MHKILLVFALLLAACAGPSPEDNKIVNDAGDDSSISSLAQALVKTAPWRITTYPQDVAPWQSFVGSYWDAYTNRNDGPVLYAPTGGYQQGILKRVMPDGYVCPATQTFDGIVTCTNGLKSMRTQCPFSALTVWGGGYYQTPTSIETKGKPTGWSMVGSNPGALYFGYGNDSNVMYCVYRYSGGHVVSMQRSVF